MRRLSLILGTLVLLTSLKLLESPHGNGFTTNCDDCHTTESWKVNPDSIAFNHDTVGMALIGQHKVVSCRTCHQSLVFNEAKSECLFCHTDIHEQTVGPDCGQCHTPNSWLVNNISDIHQRSRFPLLGAHALAQCSDCHISASLLRFDPLGTNCYDCHTGDYAATTLPNHAESGFSTNCEDCHLLNAYSWQGAGINHSFFPLEAGHNISNCQACHTSGSFTPIATACVSCHQNDYTTAANPNHAGLGFSVNCNECHTLSPGWQPAAFASHDGQFFPIYSGKHNGEWNTCADCHSNPSDYGLFTCTSCHEHNQNDMNDEHNDIPGYSYNSESCYACHPTGDAEGGFSHNTTAFPLTGAHISTACSDCHTDGYTGTSMVCRDCHESDYNASVNPNHNALGIPQTCETCHITAPDWIPATFPIHNDFYPLNGAHNVAANNCAGCHNGNYISTPNTCVGCHQPDYNQTTNPPHASAQFPVECLDCHTETAWQPSTFNHDGQYFPIYSGKHNGEWEACSECHTNPTNFAQFSCIDCHEHNKPDTDDHHQGISGYSFSSETCFACHPSGDGSGSFNHNSTAFPLTGAHSTTNCADCHTNGYSGTSMVCRDCHESDYNASVNPYHNALGIPQTCETCHTTLPNWVLASFPIHNSYYQLNGVHAAMANNCVECHNGNYTTTPNTCVGCHQQDYNQTTNPPHASAQFPVECQTCHTESAWQPSTFNHDAQYFPIYSGKHNGEWNTCADCHLNPTNFAQYSCIDCHEHNQPDMDDQHNDVNGYVYNSSACLNCHPTGESFKRAFMPKRNHN